jgi:hypothetical protein
MRIEVRRDNLLEDSFSQVHKLQYTLQTGTKYHYSVALHDVIVSVDRHTNTSVNCC